jgi:hypothetical protein
MEESLPNLEKNVHPWVPSKSQGYINKFTQTNEATVKNMEHLDVI